MWWKKELTKSVRTITKKATCKVFIFGYFAHSNEQRFIKLNIKLVKNKENFHKISFLKKTLKFHFGSNFTSWSQNTNCEFCRRFVEYLYPFLVTFLRAITFYHWSKCWIGSIFVQFNPIFLSTIESTLLFIQILWWKKPHWSDLGKMRFIRKSHDTISMEKSSCRQATMIWIISTQKINAKLQMTHVIAIFIQSLLHWLCCFCPINELELAMWKIS